tara:strand:+ start:1126 stop:1986 length:861 start_codon:yes stop_codon:yes gene_type:complete
MKILNTLVIFFLAILTSCQSKPEKTVKSEKTQKEYELIADDDGILVEKFDSTNVDENRYNHNNKIYKVGNSFKYKFQHTTPKGEIKFYRIKEDRNSWEFVDFENADSTTIKSVVIEVANGNPMVDHVPDYNQTALIYKSGSEKGYSMSGAIENEENVWIHPPRYKYFRILELNPFPYIKAPYQIGTKWTWNLTIGDHWADERWKLWEGQIENKYVYEITDKQTLNTDLGEIECFVIQSKAESRIGETKLTAYFNSNYGFVKLDYVNIDGSKTNLELIEHSSEKNGR